jgi:hypothetical protein
VTSVGWLADGTEASVRGVLATAAPGLADLLMTISQRPPAADPLWWSSSAVVDGRFVVKFAWSEIRAARLWREGSCWNGWQRRNRISRCPNWSH